MHCVCNDPDDGVDGGGSVSSTIASCLYDDNVHKISHQNPHAIAFDSAERDRVELNFLLSWIKNFANVITVLTAANAHTSTASLVGWWKWEKRNFVKMKGTFPTVNESSFVSWNFKYIFVQFSLLLTQTRFDAIKLNAISVKPSVYSPTHYWYTQQCSVVAFDGQKSVWIFSSQSKVFQCSISWKSVECRALKLCIAIMTIELALKSNFGENCSKSGWVHSGRPRATIIENRNFTF